MYFNNDEHDDAKVVAEKSNRIEEKLSFQSRFVFIYGGIDHVMAKTTCERLIALSHESADPITIVISSPGGHVESGDAIHDMIKFVRAPITIIGTGWVASAGSHIFLAVPKERRLCMPNTRFMIHQPAGGAGGQASDMVIQAREILKVRERLAQVVSEETGQSLIKVMADMERDYWMTAAEAIDYGIVSRIVRTHNDV